MENNEVIRDSLLNDENNLYQVYTRWYAINEVDEASINIYISI